MTRSQKMPGLKVIVFIRWNASCIRQTAAGLVVYSHVTGCYNNVGALAIVNLLMYTNSKSPGAVWHFLWLSISVCRALRQQLQPLPMFYSMSFTSSVNAHVHVLSSRPGVLLTLIYGPLLCQCICVGICRRKWTFLSNAY